MQSSTSTPELTDTRAPAPLLFASCRKTNRLKILSVSPNTTTVIPYSELQNGFPVSAKVEYWIAPCYKPAVGSNLSASIKLAAQNGRSKDGFPWLIMGRKYWIVDTPSIGISNTLLVTGTLYTSDYANIVRDDKVTLEFYLTLFFPVNTPVNGYAVTFTSEEASVVVEPYAVNGIPQQDK